MHYVLFSVFFCTQAATVCAQESYKVSALKEAPPASTAAAVRELMIDHGYRIQDDKGQTSQTSGFASQSPAAKNLPGPKRPSSFRFWPTES